MLGRWIRGFLGFLAAVAVVAWLRAEARLSPAIPDSPESGQFYAVELSPTNPAFDLEIDGDSRYELIVSSLGDAARSYPVRLECRRREHVELFPAVPVPPLAPRTIAQPRPPEYSRVEHVLGLAPAAERRFFLHASAGKLEDKQGYVPVTGMLAGEGAQVRVYLDRQTPPEELSPGFVEEIVRLLDDEIIPRSRDFLGEHADVDGDGKLAVLVTGWLGKLNGGTTALSGFVCANDFHPGIDPPFGNHADVIYLNPSLPQSPELKALLAHEYTHAVCFSRRLASSGHAVPLAVEEDWLNEAVAHVAENLHESGWSNLDRRIEAFLANPGRSPLVVRDYYRAGLWRDPGCRGATYLFLRYCADQFGGGLLRDLVNSPAIGKRNLERATRTGFPELYRHWTIALAEGEITSVPLPGATGGCELTGPERVVWALGEGPCTFDLSGTATTFVETTSAAPGGAVRIVVDADPQARLQLTLVRRAR
jgi:hypothetical protein